MEKKLEKIQTVEAEKQGAAQEQRERTFTQAEVNGLVARESKSAVERLLRSVGIAPEGDYKASLEAFRQWQESKNVEIEKTARQMQKLRQQNAMLSEQLKAFKMGILVEKLERYTKLARVHQVNDSVFINALKLVLKEFGQEAAADDNPTQKLEGQKYIA